MHQNFENEINKIKERYSRRRNLSEVLYSPVSYHSVLLRQEKERAIVRWIKECGIAPVQNKTLLEIGCGNGSNLLQFLSIGFDPSNIMGNELLPDRVKNAKEILPSSINIIEGDALKLNLPNESYDIVYQSMVFSSIRDKEFRKELAKKMWSMVKPGGGILWYDFIYNNPRNKDVAGVTFREVKKLFTGAEIKKWKLTLAPPLARAVSKIHPVSYSFLNMFPFLRTHILCWISKD